MHLEDYVKDRIDEAKAEAKAEDISLVFNMLKTAGNDEETAVTQLSEAFHISEEEIRNIIREHLTTAGG